MAGKKTSYSDLSAELDAILDKFQQPDIDVDKAIALYEQGIDIVKKLEKYLKETTNKVKRIKNNLKTAGE